MLQRFVAPHLGPLGPALAAELHALGATRIEERTGEVLFDARSAEAVKLCASLRCAARLFLLAASGPLEGLERWLPTAGLERFFPPGGPLALRIDSGGPGFGPTSALRRELRRRWVVRDEADPDGPGLRAELERGRLRLLVAVDGAPLHKRGWRVEHGAAALREDLGAGLLALSGWDPSTPLVEPCCGSGTIAIEAALRGLGRSPHAPDRRFACEAWSDTPRPIPPPAPAAPLVFASDLNAGALGVARRNAARAGVTAALKLTRLDLRQLERPPGPAGAVVGNLPYGVRVGEAAELPALHRAFGQRLREHFGGYRLALLVGDDRLASALALPGAIVTPLQNGGLPVRLVTCVLAA